MTGETWAEESPLVRIGAWEGRIVDGGLDDLSRDALVALRGVRVVIRDHDWRTVPVVEQHALRGERELRLTFRSEDSTASFESELRVRDVEGELLCEARVTALTAFRRNRIGIVVLHGADLAGTPFRRGDDELRFPEGISPHQPALGIRELSWVSHGRAHRLEFEGDVFEMEDQRNWTDASYKTYSTPLAAPFPVDVAPGDVVRQSVRLSCVGTSDAASASHAVGFDLDLEHRPLRMPRLAVGAATAPDAEAPAQLPPLPADAVLVELRAMDSNWRAALDRARRDASGLPLDVRVIVRDATELAPVIDALHAPEIERLGVYDATSHVTEPTLWRALVDAAAASGIPAPALVAGTRAHFTELNRTHERIGTGLPALTFSITPEMHDRSTRQVAESVTMQRLVAREAAALAADRPVHVGPITLRPRANFVATSPEQLDPGVDLRAGYGPARDAATSDARQDAPELEAWTIASAAAMTSAGVASVAYFEAWGPRGIHREGRTSPGWRALERLAPFRRADRVAADFSDGIGVLARADGTASRVLISSVRPTSVDVSILGGPRRADVTVEPFEVLEIDL